MPAPSKLGSKWTRPTHIRAAIERLNATRNKYSGILYRIREQVESQCTAIDSTLRHIDAKDRPSVLSKTMSGRRAELRRSHACPVGARGTGEVLSASSSEINRGSKPAVAGLLSHRA